MIKTVPSAQDALELRLFGLQETDRPEREQKEAEHLETDVPFGSFSLVGFRDRNIVGQLINSCGVSLGFLGARRLLAAGRLLIRLFVIESPLRTSRIGIIHLRAEKAVDGEEQSDAIKPGRQVGQVLESFEKFARARPGLLSRPCWGAIVLIVIVVSGSAAPFAAIVVVALAAAILFEIPIWLFLARFLWFGGRREFQPRRRDHQGLAAFLAGDAAANVFFGDRVDRPALGTGVVHVDRLGKRDLSIELIIIAAGNLSQATIRINRDSPLRFVYGLCGLCPLFAIESL